jgi:uncharacterized membrane protein required for colicin V production
MPNIFDAAILIIVLLCAYFGFNTGVIASVFYMASGFAGMWAAHEFSVRLGLNFYLTFVLAAAVVILAGFILGKIFKGLFLGGLDRLGGVILGVLLGLVLFGVIVFPLSKKLPAGWQRTAHASFSTVRIMPVLRKLLPDINALNLDTVKESLPNIKLPEKINLEISVPKNKKKK